MAFHDQSIVGANHVLQNFSFADETARNAATGLVAADIGKVAIQTDNTTFYILVAVTPVWREIAVIDPFDTFLELSDTPGSYASQGLKITRVNAGETALEFVDPTFLADTDTPASYSSEALKVTRVNAGETALEFVLPTFLADADTPSSYTSQGLKAVRVNAGETALEFADAFDTFLELTDTPSSYAGQALNFPRVNAAQTALEFVTNVVLGPGPTVVDRSIMVADGTGGLDIVDSRGTIDSSGNLTLTPIVPGISITLNSSASSPLYKLTALEVLSVITQDVFGSLTVTVDDDYSTIVNNNKAFDVTAETVDFFMAAFSTITDTSLTGYKYAADFSTNSTARSLIDKEQIEGIADAAATGSSLDGEVIVNESNVLTGHADFTWDDATKTLNLGQLDATNALPRLLIHRGFSTAPFPNPEAALHIRGELGFQADIYVDHGDDIDSLAGRLVFRKSAQTGDNVASGDVLGDVRFMGYFAGYQEGARIQAIVDGTPGAGDMPSALSLATSSDGSASPTERMRITSAGFVGIDKTPSTLLDVNGTGTFIDIALAASTTDQIVFDDGTNIVGEPDFTWNAGNRFLQVGQGSGSGSTSGTVFVHRGSSSLLTLPTIEHGIFTLGVNGSMADVGLEMRSDTTGDAPGVSHYRARTDSAAIDLATNVGDLSWNAWDGGQYRFAALFRARTSTTGTIASDRVPMQFEWFLRADAVGGVQRYMTMNDEGQLAIGLNHDPASLLDVDGSVAVARLASAGSPNTDDEVIIGITDTSAARTVTIQTSDIVAGRIFIIKDESGAAGTNNITIATQAGEMIDGMATVAITGNYGAVRLYSDGSDLFGW